MFDSKRTPGVRTLGLTLSFILGFLGLALAGSNADKQATVEGFSARYSKIDTPEAGWGTPQEEGWIAAFAGKLQCETKIAYRGVTLQPGAYDVWIEKGKAEWFHLFVGTKSDETAPRIKALFRLYEQEQGVPELEFKLKLTRRATKLKFSIFAGKSEGHGNLRIVRESS